MSAPEQGQVTAALLHEVARLLRQFAMSGTAQAIDLHGMALPPAELQILEAALGRGAVTAQIDASGISHVRETLYPGVWRVTHLDQGGAVIADLIEFCTVPTILLAADEDVADGLARLTSHLLVEMTA